MILAVESKTASDPAEAGFPCGKGQCPRFCCEDESEPVGPGHCFEAGLRIQDGPVLSCEDKISDIGPLHEAPRINKTRPAELTPFPPSDVFIAFPIGDDRQGQVSRGQCRPCPVVRAGCGGIVGACGHCSEMRNH